VFPPERPLDLLSEEQVQAVHDRAMTILEEIGVVVDGVDARALFRDQGQAVDGDRVRLDRQFVEAQVALAPSRFELRSRNPSRTFQIGGGSRVLAPVGGSPFCADLERGRREGTIADHDELVKLAHASPLLNCMQSGTVEAQELDESTRHMDMDYSVLRWSDKPYTCYGTSGPKARDGVELAAIACGGRDAIAAAPAILGIVNPNSPLVWDGLMVDALTEWARAGQPVVVTPFLLAGATAPVSVAGALAQQVAEALSGIALCQLIRPGCPVVYGSFFSAVDMRTGGPSFGTPESVIGTLAGAQLARHYGVPFRGGGGLCSANVLDAQAASESLNSLWAAILAGSDFVLHAAGWLESGLTASYEKLALDLEVLRMFDRLAEGIGFSDEEFALDALREEGPGGMFLGSTHTVAHFREWVFASPLFRSQAYVTWEAQGAVRAEQGATAVWKGLLDSYEDPGIDDAVDEELREYIARRREAVAAA
jgi:trimethylamine--corrinoid protein Co-methyltransferase